MLIIENGQLMAQRKSLTEAQVAVLRWISDGCSDGVMQDHHHRISAAALRNRGLVETRGRGPTWTATVTPAGTAYLAKVDGPEPPIPRQANISVIDHVVDEVVAAGGTLRIARTGYYDTAADDYVRRAHLAERRGKVPKGKLLVVRSDRDEVELRLIDTDVEDQPAAEELLPVAVPERVGRYHPAVRRFREQRGDHEVSREQLQRASLVLQAVAAEARRRHWTVEPSDGGLTLHAHELTCALGVREEGVRTRGPWEEQVHQYRHVQGDESWWRDRELPRGPYDEQATGKLSLTLDCDGPRLSGRQRTWSDRQSWSLEERLPHLFRELEERLVEARRSVERERILAAEAAERRRLDAEAREEQWRRLMYTARQRLRRNELRQQLLAEVKAWDEAKQIRAYCDAMDAAYPDEEATRAWVAWARGHATERDPLASSPALPAQREPSLDEVQPYLPKGWDASGPPAPRPEWMFR
jgi:hypothetical protein